MTEELEHFGTPCELPEAIVVADCGACGGSMYDYEAENCDCGVLVHGVCRKTCEQCGHEGCTGCMMEHDGHWFCESTDDLEAAQCIRVSECMIEWKAENAEAEATDIPSKD